MKLSKSFAKKCAVPLFCLLFQACFSTAGIPERAPVSEEKTVVRQSEPTKQETISIDGVQYTIPAMWHGQRLTAPVLTPSSFAKIPSKYAKDGAALYILAEIHAPLVAMLEKAEADGVLIQVESGYRSLRYQKKIFKKMLAKGRTFDDVIRFVAPPGYSEHMLGIAVDFSPSNWRFADLPQYQWLQDNAKEFGFIETYSRNNSAKMPWEAWHWKHTGVKN